MSQYASERARESAEIRRDGRKISTHVCLPLWEGNAFLEPQYTRVLNAIVSHKIPPTCSVILHGSVLWGDRTNLRVGLPVSDVDVLVVGNSLSDLSAAAVVLKSIAQANVKSSVPLFKLSAKFRTTSEIVDCISANELSALLHGRVLVGPTSFDVLRPNQTWFSHQAQLAITTRLIYVAEQQKIIASSKYKGVLARYLAARLVLEIATVGLLAKGLVGLSYTHRVVSFLTHYNRTVPTHLRQDLRSVLVDALCIKRDPEAHQFIDTSTAASLLVKYCRILNLVNTVDFGVEDFWRNLRPLDIRDQMLWKSL